MVIFILKVQQNEAFDIQEHSTWFNPVLSDGCMNHGPIRAIDYQTVTRSSQLFSEIITVT